MRKNSWPIFPISFILFSLENTQHAHKESNVLDDMKLGCATQRKHDPNKFIEGQFKSLTLTPTYKHEEDSQEIIFQGFIDVDEVYGKIPDMAIRMEQNKK